MVIQACNDLRMQNDDPELQPVKPLDHLRDSAPFSFPFYVLSLPDLQNKISQYSSTGARLSSPRLHILLPLNAVVPSKPEEEDTNVVFHENLPELELDIAGVRKRSYKNSVYKITQNNKVG